MNGDFTMSKKGFIESAIFLILKEAEHGVSIPDLCRKRGLFLPVFTNGAANTEESMISDMKAMAEENRYTWLIN